MLSIFIKLSPFSIILILNRSQYTHLNFYPIVQNDIPRGFRSHRRVSTVRSQQIQALEQIRKSQCQMYSQENKTHLQEVTQSDEVLSSKYEDPNMIPSNDYSIVGFDLPYNENVRRHSYTKVIF